jgi:hypothetical protein
MNLVLSELYKFFTLNNGDDFILFKWEEKYEDVSKNSGWSFIYPTLQPGSIDPGRQFDGLIVQAAGDELRQGREFNRRNDLRRVRKGGNDLWWFRKGRHDFR